jgi:hypothetical protein
MRATQRPELASKSQAIHPRTSILATGIDPVASWLQSGKAEALCSEPVQTHGAILYHEASIIIGKPASEFVFHPGYFLSVHWMRRSCNLKLDATKTGHALFAERGRYATAAENKDGASVERLISRSTLSGVGWRRFVIIDLLTIHFLFSGGKNATQNLRGSSLPCSCLPNGAGIRMARSLAMSRTLLPDFCTHISLLTEPSKLTSNSVTLVPAKSIRVLKFFKRWNQQL